MDTDFISISFSVSQNNLSNYLKNIKMILVLKLIQMQSHGLLILP